MSLATTISEALAIAREIRKDLARIRELLEAAAKERDRG